MTPTTGKGYGRKVHSVQEVRETQQKIRSGMHAAPKPKSKSHGSISHSAGEREQEATSLPGMMRIIQDVQKPGRGAVGVPGIISSTSLGPDQRNRLIAGVIETTTGNGDASGPVHRVQGVDATAYNAGMVHLAGSHFT
jgi:hypothetical protein